MSISHAIPKDAKFRPTKNVFSAPFLAGNYDFNIPANSGQTLLNLIPNTVYFIDNFSFAGNISKENFLSAIVDFPQIVIGRKMDRQSIYDSPITLTQFYEDKAASAFMTTKQDKDEALITLKAKLNQTAPIIGLDPMILTVSFNIFYMDANEYIKSFQDSTADSFLRKIRE